MPGFDDAWAAVNHRKDGERVSPELQPLLRRVYTDVLAVPLAYPRVASSSPTQK